MSDAGRVVIVGAGLAGAKTAEALRERGFDGGITLVGDEPHRPYERPPLSKRYLQGKDDRDSVFVHPESWYDEQGIDLRRDTEAVRLDPGSREIELAGGEVLRFDDAVLATGSRPRLLDLPGADLDGVLTLRRLEDSDRLKDVLAQGGRLAVIGGGWIGLEAAAAAREAGRDVSVLEAASLPLLRVLGPEMASVFTDLHRRHGVDLRTDVRIDALEGQERVQGVALSDGTRVAANHVLVGVGVVPNTEVAERAGLRVEDGIVVDEHLRTESPHVYAVGDVARAWHPLLGRLVRVEHWANALNQPAVAAANILGEPAVYERQPYFYTDQYDLGMEYVGYVEPGDYDEVVVRGDLDALEFIAFWLKDSRVRAAMNVNVWDVGDSIRALLAGPPVDRDRLADPATPL